MPTAATRSPRKSYPSDLSDQEWAIIEPMIPHVQEYPNLQEQKHSRREILNAIRYRTRTGCAWRLLPHDLPPWKTVYNTYRKWAKCGVVQSMHDALVERVRAAEGRNIEPTAAILDSQSVKISSQGGLSGYDAGKKVKGRKRHILVDVLGLLLVLLVTPASVQDRDGAVPVIQKAALNHSYIKKIWVDGAYRGAVIDQVQQETSIKIEVIKRSDSAEGFEVLPRRWVVERTFGWLERFRLLSREHERTQSSSESDIHHAMSMIMVRRLGKA